MCAVCGRKMRSVCSVWQEDEKCVQCVAGRREVCAVCGRKMRSVCSVWQEDEKCVQCVAGR